LPSTRFFRNYLFQLLVIENKALYTS
jgi:hypothetical protein